MLITRQLFRKNLLRFISWSLGLAFLCASGTAFAANEVVFAPGFTMAAGETESVNGYNLTLQANCDLVLSTTQNVVVWSSNTASAQCSSPALTYQKQNGLTITGTVGGVAGTQIWTTGVSSTTQLILSDVMPWLELRNTDASMAWSTMHRLADIQPSMASTIGYNDPTYALSAMATSPVTAAPGDDTDQFVAPDGKTVTVTVKAPVTTRTYHAPPISANEDPATYFQQQIAAAGSGAVLVFPKAVYNFGAIDCTNSSDPNFRPNYIMIPMTHDTVIDGQGSTLNFQSNCDGVYFYQAARVVFENFVINWPNWNTASVGTITAVNPVSGGGYSYNIQFPTTNMVSSFGVVTAWDTKTNDWSLTAPHNEIYYSANYTPSASGLATNVPSWGTKFTVGATYLARNMTGTANAITDWDSQDVTLSHDVIYNSPDLGILISLGRGVRITHCTVTRTGNNPISTTADAVHFGSFGGDVIIENNEFEYQGDDGLNIHTEMMPLSVTPSCGSSGGDCPVTLPSSFGASNGDVIALFNTATKYITTQLASCSNGNCTVNAAAISGGGVLADMTLGNARYIIRSNVFAYNRARGALLQAPYGLVQGNEFIGQSLFSMYFVVSSYWQEGAGAQDVLAINNVIESPGNAGDGAATVAAENSAGVIYQGGSGGNAAPPIPGTNQNLIFAHNDFESIPNEAFYLSSANDVVLDGNTLANTNLVKMKDMYGNSSINPNYATVIDDASNLLLKQNILSGSTTAGLVAYDPSSTNNVAAQ
jgi:hypothetical protein